MPKPIHRTGNLPAEVTSFVGRRTELAEVRQKLTAGRLVSLVGPGGVGKTRLAVRTARDLGRSFPHGAWLVELGELRDPTLVSNAVLSALRLRDQTATEPVALLRSYLDDKVLLLVVDNCEHLLDAAATLVGDVIRAAPGVRVIATSREPLSAAGEHVLPVPPLPLPTTTEPLAALRQNEAVSLFVERATAASGSFQLTAANRGAVVELCRRLDGLPLAIELAAVRTRALSPEQIRDRLSDRFDLLTGGSRNAPSRHQTLRTTIEWSYDLLTPVERTLLVRLSVFAGHFTLDDVEGVCCSVDVPTGHVVDLLSSLLDKSLVVREDAGATVRYRLPETMREYARLMLREAGDEDALERRCAEYYLARCRLFAREGRHRLLDWLAWTELEIDNVRAVLYRQESRFGVELATCLIWYWVTRGTTEGVRCLDTLLDRDVAHPWAYFVRGFLAVLQFDPDAGTPALARGIEAARTAGQPEVLAQLLAMASIAATMAGDRASSRRLLAEAQAVADDVRELGATLMTLQARALNGLLNGELADVRVAAEQGARLSREAGDLYSLDMMLMNDGLAALLSGTLTEAEQRFAEGLRLARRLDDRVAQCYLIGGLGCCAAGLAQPRLAAQLLGAMENLRAEAGATINASLAPAVAQATAAVTALLSRAVFDAEFDAGQRLSRAAAARLALRETPAAATADQQPVGVLRQRETDVALLVADGLSNKQIGARLFISERTVESHVRNILHKLGFTSRAQIAGWIATNDR